jgi:hypothetical protein
MDGALIRTRLREIRVNYLNTVDEFQFPVESLLLDTVSDKEFY